MLVVGWTSEKLHGSYTQFCVFAIRTVIKTRNKISGKSKSIKDHRSKLCVVVVFAIDE